LTGNDEDGKDLFWETCLTIEKYEHTFDMNCSNPDHWILKIMVNLWSQEYNRKKNTISLDSKYTNEYGEKYTIDYPDDENLEIKIDSDELRLDVKRVLSELPDDERLALVLADLEEKDHQEAAKIVGMSLKDFRNSRKRAVRHIRQKIG
jgi:RNA polymerase sigma factor (sigma-70 family)